ncbi:MAG: DUF4007 family protein [Acidimicrobiaceae bacterium]|nr:DUF4007 family protein [Acidimicrobiia bacterium]MCY4493300.1 DUF4007 family protein [Acidimicrobiaceae bacterium]
MRLVDAAEPTFARHETFHPRYGWFRKACAVVESDPGVFARVDAPVVIGVGKNMVRAIRFWGLAAKLIVEDPESSNRRSPGLVQTRIGRALFGESGWDRYMEDPGTLWLLHWLLLAAPSRLPVWWLAFNDFNAVEFDEEDLGVAAAARIGAVTEWSSPNPSSLHKDVSALLRTYAPADNSRRIGIDDLLDCPLRELNLVRRSAATGRYRFSLGPKAALPAAIVAYAALDYVARAGTGSNTVTLSRLANEPGAPGQVYKLTEAELRGSIESMVDATAALSLTALTGAAQLSWSQDPAAIATSILDDYYGVSPGGVSAGFHGDQPAADASLEGLFPARVDEGDSARQTSRSAATGVR